jgi:hypothetical protein
MFYLRILSSHLARSNVYAGSVKNKQAVKYDARGGRELITIHSHTNLTAYLNTVGKAKRE